MKKTYKKDKKRFVKNLKNTFHLILEEEYFVLDLNDILYITKKYCHIFSFDLEKDILQRDHYHVRFANKRDNK